jgi:hypothetical protein
MYYGNTQLVPIPKTSEKGKIVVTGTGYVYTDVLYLGSCKAPTAL